MNGVTRSISRTLALALLLLAAVTAPAQVSEVVLSVPREQLGLSGRARLGAWTPIRIGLENRSSEPRQVLCRWLLDDADGDRVLAQRRITLDALGQQEAWLYGPLPVRWRANQPWAVQVLNEQGTEELTRADLAPPDLIQPSTRLIGIAGTHAMGLGAYLTPHTSHEPIGLLTGLSLTTLPDRWYGLSAIDTLIWTRNGGDPLSNLLSSANQQALREWVRRGGHLVIMLPAYGEPWTGSPLADLLPVDKNQVRRLQGRPPSWLGAVRGQEVLNLDLNVFDVRPGDGVDVIRRYNNQPVVVAKRFGTGRVTLCGLDMTDPRFAQMGLPNGRFRLWNDVFMWQAPVYEKAYIEAAVRDDQMSRADQRTPVPLGRFIPGQVSMRGAAAPALLAAILIFGLYWFAAGPLSLIILKKRNAVRHSWGVFVAVVLLFSGLCWAGAWLMAPKRAGIAHFTILTASADSPTVHAHSWLSLYLPRFAKQTVELDPDHPTARHTLASPGLVTGLDESGFVDPQSYNLDMASPRAADIPFRATAKQLEVDFLGSIGEAQTGLSRPLVLPQADRIRIENALPTGKLSHGLPGPLRNVVVLYCPGDNQTPWVWQMTDEWPPQQVVELDAMTRRGELVIRPQNATYDNRQWKKEGYLGLLMDNQPGQQLIQNAGGEITTSRSEMIKYIELLCLYDTLPPPDFRRTGFPQALVYRRSLGRQLDLTRLLAGKRLIVIGHLQDSPLPVPLTVQGEEVTASGWTVLRWVYDLP